MDQRRRIKVNVKKKEKIMLARKAHFEEVAAELSEMPVLLLLFRT